MIEQFELARNDHERTSIAFSRDFAEAFAAGRFEYCVRMMDFPMPIVRAQDTLVIATAEEELTLLEKRRADYIAAGAVHFDCRISAPRCMEPGLALVDFDWYTRDSDRRLIAAYSVTHVQRIGSGIQRIAGFINHSEAEHRPMFLATDTGEGRKPDAQA